MKSAWVITQEGTRHPTEVIGIISARKSAKTVKEYVEWFYALLHFSPRDHLDFAKYHNPFRAYEAQYWTTNTGVPVHSLMICGHNPYLVARLAKNVALDDANGKQPVLEWTEPDRFVCDPKTHHIIEKIPGTTSQAPVHLPLRIT